MPFTHEHLTSHRFASTEQAYEARDTMLYALGLGLGADPLDARQLRFVYEKELEALPMMAVVLGHPGFWAGDPALGIDWVKMLHVGQGLTVHRPLAAAGRVRTTSRVADVIDRGEGRGALLYYERDVWDAEGGDLIATVRQTLLCRGNGGFGGAPRDVPASRAIPDRAADCVAETQTLPQAALLYRLSGDMNPLHADPVVAARGGFDRPILHGLATFGMAASTLILSVLEGEASSLEALDVRFTAPVMPGDRLSTEIWDDGDVYLFRTKVPERGVVVLDGGVATVKRGGSLRIVEKAVSVA